MAWYDKNPNWAMEAVNKALELETQSIEETTEITKTALDIGIGSGAIIGGLLGAGVGRQTANAQVEQKYKQMYGNAVAKVLNEQNQKLIELSSDHYSQIENIDQDLKILFTPVSVAFMLKNTVIDTLSTDEMTASMKTAWRNKDRNYFKNLFINKVYLDSMEAEQMFIRRLIEQDKSLRDSLSKKSSTIGSPEELEEMHTLEIMAGCKYMSNLFSRAEQSETLSKYANVLVDKTSDWEDISVPLELGALRYATDDDYDLGLKKLAFLWFGKDNVHEMDELTPDYLKKNMSVVYLPDRVLYVTDDIVVSQMNVMGMNEEGYNRFQHRDSNFFKDQFFDLAKKAGYEVGDLEKEGKDEPTETLLDASGSSISALLKRAGMISYESGDTPIKKGSRRSQEKLAAKNSKIEEIENAFTDDIAKKVAYMIATSHEYKTPNVKAGLSFAKNYNWELSTEKVRNLQGINKPIIKEKVKNIADSLNPRDPGSIKPLVIVNQLHGVRPQTPRKKILMDGHHRLEACEFLGIEEVPVYKGTYTGNAEKTYKELQEKSAAVGDRAAFYKELFTKKGIHPKVYYLFLMKEFGGDWISWEIDVLLDSIQDIYGVGEIPDIVVNKLMCLTLLMNSDSPYTGFHTFEKVVRAFNDKLIDFEVRESNLSLGEMVNACRIMADLIVDKDDNLYDNFSEHTLAYIVEVLAEQNYRVCAHKTNSNNEKLFWDLVNLELLEHWTIVLPNGLNLSSEENAKLEAKGIQRITKELCDKYRGSKEFGAIRDEVKARVQEFGFSEPEVFESIVMENIVDSLAVDVYVDEMNKTRDEQIKDYID